MLGRAYRFFKRASHERANFLSINAVTCDGHQMSSTRHDVTQQRQVTVIYIRTVKRYHVIHFTLHCLPDSFNSKNLQGDEKIQRLETD